MKVNKHAFFAVMILMLIAIAWFGISIEIGDMKFYILPIKRFF